MSIFVSNSKRSIIISIDLSSDGIIDNWNDLEDIWEHVMYEELSLTPGETPILLSEIATAPREQREKCLEVRIPKYSVHKLSDTLLRYRHLVGTDIFNGFTLGTSYILIQGVQKTRPLIAPSI